jgi:hypothetical protein
MARDSLGNSNNATATVTVLQSALVASINGGNRSVGAGSLLLDSSLSTDPDVSGGAGLSHAWSCIRGGAVYGQACDVTLAAASTQTVMLVTAGEIFFLQGFALEVRLVSHFSF